MRRIPIAFVVVLLGATAAGCGGHEPADQPPPSSAALDAAALDEPSGDVAVAEAADVVPDRHDASIDTTPGKDATPDGPPDIAIEGFEAADVWSEQAAVEAGDAAEADTAVADAGPCGLCHGSPANPAPPRDLKGHTQTTFPSVGAHQSHLAPSSWHLAVSCEQCHVVPATPSYDPGVPTHMNGVADLVWGPVAKAGSYDPAARTCAGTHCHGGTMLPDVQGASTERKPNWTALDGTQAKCAKACHSLPPGGYHPNSTACPACHGPAISQFDPAKPEAAVWANAALHVDGKTDVSGLVCTSCHGDQAKGKPAPPIGTHGETATTDRAVGAHAQHLGASTWHRDGQCTDCHVVPASMVHANGTVDLAWSGPSVADGAQPSFDGAAVTCKGAYCHGSTLLGPKTGGVVSRSPVWTKVDGTYDACGATCHTNPPGGAHPTSTACQKCHGSTIALFDAVNPSASTWADRARHVDGTVDLKMTCTSCHGDDAKGTPAPPLGTHGETATTERAVGAHAQHLGTSAWHRDGQCADCHVVPGSTVHANGTADLAWSGPSVADGAQPSFDGAAVTCKGAYCHGATLLGPNAGGVVSRSPVWTKVNGTYDACGTTCHTNPPGGTHPTSTACAKCHGPTIAAFDAANPSASTWADRTRHVDGTVDLKMTCTSCHGDDSAGNPAPPLGTHGESATTERAVGAHAQHLGTSTWHRDGHCADCHVVPGSTVHANGKVDLAWSGPSVADGAQPSFDGGTATCGGVYCHGSTLLGPKTGGVVSRTPVWTKVDGTYDACGTTCHTNPPGSTHPTYPKCAICHKPVIGAYDPQTSQATWTDRTLHVDGLVQRAPYHDLPGWKAPKGTTTHHGYYYKQMFKSDEHGVLCTECHGLHLSGGAVNVPCMSSGCHTQNECTVCHKIH